MRSEETATPSDENADRMPGAMESTEGSAPEIVTHNASAASNADELSPEEQAIQGLGAADGDPERKEFVDEDTDTAALAEGRVDPPAPSKDEPA